jgi:hypothetical protein
MCQIILAALLLAGSLALTKFTVMVASPIPGVITDATGIQREAYVSLDGRDSNPGTLSRPWRTIQHAAVEAHPGQIVNVRAGVYRETVSIKVSGSASGGVITFRSYPGETAVVDGTGMSVAYGGQSGIFDLQGISYITIQGFEIRNYTSNSVNRTPAGISVAGSGSHLQFLNNHIHHITTTAKGATCASGRSNTANAFGLVVYGTEAPASLNTIVIRGNELDHLKTGCSESLVVNGNVEGWTITENKVHDANNIGIDAIGFEQVAPQPKYDRARNGKISDNVIYNITSDANVSYAKGDLSADGIYVDGGAGITIERNLIRNVDVGIEMASEAPGRTTGYVVARNNVIFHNNAVGITIGGYARSVGGTDHCVIVNNTLFDNDLRQTGSGEFQIQYHAVQNVFKNNLVYAGSESLFVNSLAGSRASPATINHNLYYLSSGEAASRWVWRGSSLQSYQAYRHATHQDSHSMFTNPKIVSLAGYRFELQASSPGINSGEDLGASVVGAVDFAGHLRVLKGKIDIGAYEH